ncbi:MAG: hypothetical protein KBD06_01055 [Candidatus Pacebacteria bacterium]|nr:hypothetical protein [Candidatus Paceibacterota bacterium]
MRYLYLRQIGPVRFHIPLRQVERMKNTCFRGQQLRLASNLHRWNSPREIFQDKLIIEYFKKWVETVSPEEFGGVNSGTVAYDASIGWSGTAPIEEFDPSELEVFHPNRNSSALRVRTDMLHITAPKTNLLTFIFRARISDDFGQVVDMQSMYPGPDIGKLKGNISEREKVAFFDFNHPGQL